MTWDETQSVAGPLTAPTEPPGPRRLSPCTKAGPDTRGVAGRSLLGGAFRAHTVVVSEESARGVTGSWNGAPGRTEMGRRPGGHHGELTRKEQRKMKETK